MAHYKELIFLHVHLRSETGVLNFTFKKYSLILFSILFFTAAASFYIPTSNAQEFQFLKFLAKICCFLGLNIFVIIVTLIDVRASLVARQ